MKHTLYITLIFLSGCATTDPRMAALLVEQGKLEAEITRLQEQADLYATLEEIKVVILDSRKDTDHCLEQVADMHKYFMKVDEMGKDIVRRMKEAVKRKEIMRRRNKGSML